MTGYTEFAEKKVLDYMHPTSGASDYIAYSTNGTSEWSDLSRTAVGAAGWDAATGTAPAEKVNKNKITSAGAGGTGTVTHFALYDAATSGNQITDWTALDTPVPLISGGKVEWDVGDLKVTLD